MTGFVKRFKRPSYLLWLVMPFFLWISLRQVPLTEILNILNRLEPSRLALLIGFNLVVMFFFSSRWWIILRAQGYKLPYLSLLAYRTAAFSISYFTPGTQFGGEPLQVYLLERRHNLPGSTALAAVTLDKLFELLSNFTFLMLGIALTLQAGLVAWISPQLGFLWAAGFLLIPSAYLLGLWSGRSPFSWLIAKIPDHVFKNPRLQGMPTLVRSTENQLSSLLKSKPRTFVAILLISGLVWLLSLAEYWLALYLLGAQLDIHQLISAMTAARLAFLTPLPGGVGALEASQSISLQAMGFSPALGISISLWIRGRDIALGLLGAWWGAILARRHNIQISPYQAIE